MLRQHGKRSREPMGLSHRHTARQSTYARTGVDDVATAALQMREDRGARMPGKAEGEESQGLCDRGLDEMGKGSPGSCHKGDATVGSLKVQDETCG